MSEGTPGRGPDADTRTDAGAGQGAASGRPSAPPVRYGPRNGNARNEPTGPGGSNGRTPAGRTVPGTSSPQQYRAPQPGTNGNGSNGNGANGNGSAEPKAADTVAPSNGYGPASSTRPRPAQPAARPSEQDRAVADARIAAAARNASVAKGRSGSGTGTTPPPAAPSADDTAVVPKVEAGTTDDQPTQAPSGSGTTADGGSTATEARPAGLRSMLRDRRWKPSPLAETATAAAAGGVAGAAAVPESARVESTTPEVTSETPEPAVAASAASPTPEPNGSGDATQERTLTWRDRLGLPPKAEKPQPVAVPDSGPGVPTAAAAAAVAATVAAGSAPPETKASPTGPTTAPDQTLLREPVTPASPGPVSSDTVVIPSVEAGAVAPSAPAAAGTTQALVGAKPRVGLARRTRKARLRLSRVDPWSVMKTAFLFSIAAGIILVVATYGVWSVLNASGLFDAVNDMVKSVVSTPGDTTPFRIEEYVNTQKVLGVAAILAVIDVLIFTALATLGSFLYNLAATVLGGLEVTLAED